MTACLLCASTAVADSLCVPCGAKLWACQKWQNEPKEASKIYMDLVGAEGNHDCGSVERERALLATREISTRLGFFAALESCRLQREIHELQKNRGKDL